MDNIYKGKGLPKIEDEPEKLEIPVFKILFVIFIIISVVRFFSFDTTVLKNVDMEPFSEPVQVTIENGQPFSHKVSEGTAIVTPLAEYKIYGRVMDRHYRPSKLPVASMYPYDVSIGFGDFKYKEVYKAVKVKMASTTSYWSYSASAAKMLREKYFKQKGISHYFTNNHLCPANKKVRRGLSKLRKKDIVYIEGYLVKFELKRKDGTIEKGISSTSRDDTLGGNNGNGNCEQIFVTRVVSRHGDYK